MNSSIPENVLKDWLVLVVDDEPDAAELINILLSMYGATVIVANDGAQALDLVRKRRPRFVVTDLSMPHMSGWELANTIKNDRTLMEIPVVALTAHAMRGDREKALAAGFHNFITKPIVPENFVSQLLTILAFDMPELRAVMKEN
jgi:CheY-like chemotaxis protein